MERTIRIPFFGFVYKVRPGPTKWTEGWRGWRLKYWAFGRWPGCDCGATSSCDGTPWIGIGWVDKPMFAPNVIRSRF